MSAALNLEAERAAFETAMRGDCNFARTPSGHYLSLATSLSFAGWLAAHRTAPAVGADGLPALPKASAWRHTMDNTEGLKGNKPYVVLTITKASPFGRPGVDYSQSFPVTAKPLYTNKQVRKAQRDAIAADRQAQQYEKGQK